MFNSFTDQLYQSLGIAINNALIKHILSKIGEETWLSFDFDEVWPSVKEHLQDHQVDDTTFYTTVTYLFLLLYEISSKRNFQLDAIMSINSDTVVH